MGSKLVSISHVKTLLKNVPKSVHFLVQSDISPLDRQNYASLEKIMTHRVIEALEKNVIDSEATVMYIRLCKQITSSFLDVHMKPIDRIYNIWHAVYFLRAWRKWIKSSENNYCLDENFITANAYACIEINAHSLVYSILKLRINHSPEMFQTSLFSSQLCEHMFRKMRSMGTPNFTKINFNLYELLHMIARLELMNNIICHSKWDSGTIVFPKSTVYIKNEVLQLPTDAELLKAMKDALEDALKNARTFGIIFQPADIIECELQKHTSSDTYSDNSEILSDLGSDDDDDDDYILQNNTENDPRNDHTSFVQIENEDGTFKEIRKSTLVWFLTESKGGLSSDRLKRVQTPSQSNENKRRKIESSQRKYDKITLCKKLGEIGVGQWCVFKNTHEQLHIKKSSQISSLESSCSNIFENVVVGAVACFKYFHESAQQQKSKIKTKPFTSDIAEVNPAKSADDMKASVRVLASWYYVACGGTLHPIKGENCYFIPIENYIATIDAPIKNPQDSNANVLLLNNSFDIRNELIDLF